MAGHVSLSHEAEREMLVFHSLFPFYSDRNSILWNGALVFRVGLPASLDVSRKAFTETHTGVLPWSA